MIVVRRHGICRAASTARLLLAAALAALSFSQALAQEKPELRIAVITSTTGGASTLGLYQRDATDLYAKSQAAGADLPFSIKIVSYDDGSDPTKAVSLTRKAIQEDRVHAVVCCSTSPNSLAIIDTINSAKLPMISMAAAVSIITPVEARPYTFKTGVTDKIMVRHTAKFMKARGINRVAFFGPEDSYGESGFKELKEAASELGLTLAAVERFSSKDTNFAPQALALRKVSLDAVYIHAIPPSANLAHEALKRVGYTGPIFHGAGAASNTFLNLGKAHLEGAIVGVVGPLLLDQLPKDNPIQPQLARYVELFDAAYGNGKAEISGAQAWDALNLIVNAYRKIDGPKGNVANLAAERVALKDSIERTRLLAGLNGVVSMAPTDHLGLDERSAFLAQVKAGRFILLKE